MKGMNEGRGGSSTEALLAGMERGEKKKIKSRDGKHCTWRVKGWSLQFSWKDVKARHTRRDFEFLHRQNMIKGESFNKVRFCQEDVLDKRKKGSSEVGQRSKEKAVDMHKSLQTAKFGRCSNWNRLSKC